MAVVTVKSSQITNADSLPVVLSNPYLAGGGDIEEVANCVTGATDSAGSVYLYTAVPSGARILDIGVMNDANTSGTSYKCGVYLLPTDPSAAGASNAVVVANSDTIFFSAVTMASARNTWTYTYFPAIAGSSGAVSNVEKRVWELLGLTADPLKIYRIGIAAVTPGTAGGNMALRVAYCK